jgi:hypothetical protein
VSGHLVRGKKKRNGSGVCYPKAAAPGAFYTLVSRDTDEQEFAHHRQLFLTEQGYTYRITDESEWSL